MTTPNDLIALSAKAAGILGQGQTLSAEDVNDCFAILNLMLDQWQHQRWMVYHLVDHAISATGATSYSVGSGGDFDIPRPDMIDYSFFRRTDIGPQPPDYPLERIQAREDYDAIRLKSLAAFPQFYFYDSGYPLGYYYPWPIPNLDVYELHITTKEQLSDFTSLSQTISLPRSYTAAIVYTLANKIREFWQMPPNPVLLANAVKARDIIRSMNFQIGRLHVPDELVSRGVYDPYSDRSD